jgi:hypothetical protein
MIHEVFRNPVAKMYLAMDAIEGGNTVVHVDIRFQCRKHIVAHDDVRIVGGAEEPDDEADMLHGIQIPKEYRESDTFGNYRVT